MYNTAKLGMPETWYTMKWDKIIPLNSVICYVKEIDGHEMTLSKKRFLSRTSRP